MHNCATEHGLKPTCAWMCATNTHRDGFADSKKIAVVFVQIRPIIVQLIMDSSHLVPGCVQINTINLGVPVQKHQMLCATTWIYANFSSECVQQKTIPG